ncbi:BTAD domain-containing putative transcriptional regulator [Taklimakanibacter deserti]|uniref:BTAD domain-containing putative transcriptional regulator n=1 Tax=Taklimakanibacter deserti TaxID=2267839 RepID=UPI000E659D58
MASLEILLLGGFQLRKGDQAIDLPGRRERALLAYLAMPAGEARSRDKLASMLWSERGDKQARDSLKQAMLRLRKTVEGIEPAPLLSDREFVTLDPAAVSIDVAEFERLTGEGTPEAALRAMVLYRGDLLDGLEIRDPAFEEWLLMERQRLRDLAREALANLLARHMADGAHDQAAPVARRLVGLDPLREDAHRALMRIYAEQGQTALALKQYQTCRDRLRAELGVKPETETERLHQSIQHDRSSPRQSTQDSAAPVESATAPTLKPSIAVLPFANLSGDPGQEYFSDGITEDIIAGLARLHWLFVIARNSSFTFKGKAVDAKEIGTRLGVRYLLEGSVRKAGERVRIACRLIDAGSGLHLWTDRFEGTLSDVFDLQDRITSSVVGAIAPRLRDAEIERARRKPTDSIDAYDLFLRALALHNTVIYEDGREALRLLDRAIELDPDYAAAYGLAAYCRMRQRQRGWVDSTTSEGVRLARLAARKGQDDPDALWMAGVSLAMLIGESDEALALIERSLGLNPNSAGAWLVSGVVRAYAGDSATGIAHFERSIELNPLDPLVYIAWYGIAFAHFAAERYEESSAWLDRSLRALPSYLPALRLKIAICGLKGQTQEGEKWVERLLAVVPDVTISKLRQHYEAGIRRPDCRDRLFSGLRLVGLPE